jgi:predicted DsbA family dithiol-disulfide isomerase
LCALVAVHSILYYTDPACPLSWAAEPGRRRLQREFGESVAITYVMGGLAREFEHPQRWLHAWLDAAESAMPVDPRLWLDAPPRGSYPACLAVLVAGEQGLGTPYLRRAREAIACEGRRLDHSDALVELARDVSGLNVERFTVDLGSHAILEAFGADLERTRAAGEGTVPRLELQTDAGEAIELRGAELLDPQAWVAGVALAGGRPNGQPPPAIEAALREHGRLAAPEVAALCDLPGPRAAAELWRLASEWRVTSHRHLTGELWQMAA